MDSEDILMRLTLLLAFHIALLLFSLQVSQQSVSKNNHAHLDCYSQSILHDIITEANLHTFL